MTLMRILVVEDDKRLGAALQRGLEAESFAVDVANTGTAGHWMATTTEYDLGARRYNRTGETLPESVLVELKQHDAILLGAVGDPSVPPAP